jgi:hypothetical protein
MYVHIHLCRRLPEDCEHSLKQVGELICTNKL